MRPYPWRCAVASMSRRPIHGSGSPEGRVRVTGEGGGHADEPAGGAGQDHLGAVVGEFVGEGRGDFPPTFGGGTPRR